MAPHSPMQRVHNISSLLVILALLFCPRMDRALAGPLQQGNTSLTGFSWSKSFGNSYWITARALAADTSGSIFMTGAFNQTVDFGTGPLTSAGYEDIFLAKYDAAGKPLWTKRFGSPGSDDRGNSLATDSAGNVYITGHFFGSVNFGGGPLSSPVSPDIFLAKYDANGNHLWSKRFGGSGMDSGQSLAIDPDGNVLLTGYFSNVIGFGGGLLGSSGRMDIFLAKFDSNGSHIWSKSFGAAEDDEGVGLAIDSSGSVILTGSMQGSVDFGGGSQTSAGVKDIFLVRYDADGSHLWSKVLGSTEWDSGRSLGTDPQGRVFLTGDFQGSVDFGVGPLASAGGSDIFLAAYDKYGSPLWSKRFGDAEDDLGWSITLDDLHTVFVTGFMDGSVNFGGGARVSAGGSDIFLARFAADGSHLYSERFGDMGLDYGMALDSDSSGNVFMAGRFGGTVDFGSGPINAGSGSSIFLTRQVFPKRLFLPAVSLK